MPAGRITEEEQLRIHNRFLNVLNSQVEEGQKASEKLVEKLTKFDEKRNASLRITEETAKYMKHSTDATFGVETFLRVVSLGGKVAVFGGPASAVIGSSASLTADVTKASISRKRIKDWEEKAKCVMTSLQEDFDATAELCDAMNQTRRVALFLAKVIQTFHSGTIEGYFDNIPSLRSFVEAVRSIREVRSIKGMLAFLSILKQRAQALATDSKLSSSLLGLLTYNPDVLTVSLAIPDIICDIGFLACGGAPSGLAGGLLRSLNIFGIVTDAVGLYTRLRAYDTYPKLAQELLKINEQLVKGKEKVGKLKESLEKTKSTSLGLEKREEKKEDVNELKKREEKKEDVNELKKREEKKEDLNELKKKEEKKEALNELKELEEKIRNLKKGTEKKEV